MKVTDLIAATRDGRAVPADELYAFVKAIASGMVPDYQTAAWLMAAYVRGLSRDETVSLTLAMRDSGSVMQWGEGAPAADKHSTGGVGDKVSLVLAPLAAAAGLRVPMVSGRSLGHTGGTLDKLESIPGMSVDIPLKRFVELVDENGFAMCGQTRDIAPADGRLYSLRDATSTVTSIPLICASILSKKLAENTDALVFDVKTGRGAFMRSPEDARELAEELTAIARSAGVRSAALITAMDHPLGMMTGNALEVSEALEVLRGGGPSDIRELSVELTSEMLGLADPASYPDAGMAVSECERLLDDGTAFDRFEAVVKAQGGDLEAFDSLPRARVMEEVRSDRSGFWSGPDAFEVGEAVRALGGGRYSMQDRIRPEVGWEQVVPAGTEVAAGDILGIVHAAAAADAEEAAGRISRASLWDEPPKPLIMERV